MRFLRLVLLYLAVWVAMGLVASSQSLLVYAANQAPLDVALVLRYGMPSWIAWAVLSPIAIFAARRWPAGEIGWPKWIGLHIGVGSVLWVSTTWLGLVIRNLGFVNAPSIRPFIQDLFSSLSLTFLIYVLVISVVRLRDYLGALKEREVTEVRIREQLSEARLEALRAQLHPHFLFNTMHAIAAQIRSNPKGAEDMLAELADLIRHSLEGVGNAEVSLADELEFVDRYLGIQEARFGDRLSVELEIPEPLLDQAVPPMILQPLVENAIEHGVAKVREGGCVTISASSSGVDVEIRVRNDGPKSSPDQLEPSQWRVGLENTQARLQTMYGEAHRVVADPRDDGGAIVRFTVPRASIGSQE